MKGGWRAGEKEGRGGDGGREGVQADIAGREQRLFRGQSSKGLCRGPWGGGCPRVHLPRHSPLSAWTRTGPAFPVTIKAAPGIGWHDSGKVFFLFLNFYHPLISFSGLVEEG